VSSDRIVPRLLAGRDRLGRIEKDAILDAVLASAAPKRTPLRWWWLAAPAVAAAAVLVLVLYPRGAHDEFAARGSDRAVAVFHPTCGAAPCALGSKLMFDIHGTTEYRYVAAFAKRGDGTVVWYFAGADIASAVSGVLDRGVELDAPGTYRIYGVFSRDPLTREQIRERFDEHTAGPDTAIVTTDLELR
jgi:hypothetical protein